MTPPSTDSTTASTRNWASTSPGWAPIARRMPISRVRSVTLTSMMFMIPMPPTTSETAATPPSSMVIVSETLETREMMSVLLRMVKSSAARRP